MSAARNMVASPHWEWLPGMALTDGYRVNAVCSERHEQDVADGLGGWLLLVCIEDMDAGDHASSYWGRTREPDIGPDLADPATCGCLLTLVRKAWGADSDGVRVDVAVFEDGSARVEIWVPDADCERAFLGDSLGLALAAALLAAPAKAGEQ
jgi:hypothetical protein